MGAGFAVDVDVDVVCTFFEAVLVDVAAPGATAVWGGTMRVCSSFLQCLRVGLERDQGNTRSALLCTDMYRWCGYVVQDGYKYVQAMLSVLKNVTKDETVQYVLAMLDEVMMSSLVMTGSACTSEDSVASASAPASASAAPGEGKAPHPAGGRLGMMQRLFFPQVEGCTCPCGVLAKLLSRDDWFTKEKAATVLSVVLMCGANVEGLPAASVPEIGPTTDALIDWCVHQLKKPSHPQFAVPTALHCLSLLLKEPASRRAVYASGGVQAVVGVLTRDGAQSRGIERGANTVSVQAQYELALCVWLLSLFPPAAEILATPGVIEALVGYVRLAHKEKVIRVALLGLKSLLAGDSAMHSRAISLELSAVESGLPKAIEHRKNQEWDDPDMIALLDHLQDRLDAGVLAMSSMEQYKKEIAEGVLVPGPMHDSEAFWLENAGRLLDNNSATLKELLGLLDPSHDATTLQLACRGVRNFVQYYPHGKGLVSDLQGKTLVMRLMAHPDRGVQREALLCIQRLLLSKGNLSYLVSS